MDCTSKNVIVTGAGQGIGRATAILFGKYGANVAVAELHKGTGAETTALVKETGVKSIFIKTDVTDFDMVQSMIAETEKQLGPVDILVNNVGWNEHSFFMDQEKDFWDKVVNVNFMSQVLTCRAVLDGMVKRRKGAIVNFSSDAGRVGTNGETVYAGAKGAVIAFSKSLSREVTRFGIRVNVVSPGPTNTDQWKHSLELQPKIAEKIASLIPMKRVAEPEEIANAVVFLASDAASYITGQVLSVNGGLNML